MNHGRSMRLRALQTIEANRLRAQSSRIETQFPRQKWECELTSNLSTNTHSIFDGEKWIGSFDKDTAERIVEAVNRSADLETELHRLLELIKVKDEALKRVCVEWGGIMLPLEAMKPDVPLTLRAEVIQAAQKAWEAITPEKEQHEH